MAFSHWFLDNVVNAYWDYIAKVLNSNEKMFARNSSKSSWLCLYTKQNADFQMSLWLLNLDVTKVKKKKKMKKWKILLTQILTSIEDSLCLINDDIRLSYNLWLLLLLSQNYLCLSEVCNLQSYHWRS